jgi:hypothetical protein
VNYWAFVPLNDGVVVALLEDPPLEPGPVAFVLLAL